MSAKTEHDNYVASWPEVGTERPDEFAAAMAELPPTAAERLARGEGVKVADASGRWPDFVAAWRRLADPEAAGSIPRTAIERAEQSDLPGQHGGPADAYRHGELMRGLSERYGETAAAVLGAAHELKPVLRAPFESAAGGEGVGGVRRRWRDSGMDLVNNAQALRVIGQARKAGKSEAEISALLKQQAESAEGNTGFNAFDVILGSASGRPVVLDERER